MAGAFQGAFNMIYNAADVPGLASVTNMSRMFDGAGSFDGDIPHWDVSSVNDVSYMFEGTRLFNQDISSWDVSWVTDMSSMFEDATAFNGDISSWDVSQVNDMYGMFWDATSFSQNLGAWYTVPDSTIIKWSDTPETVGTISSQNAFLDRQQPTYIIGTGDDSYFFEITGSTLVPNTIPTKPTYSVNITSIGTFDADSYRIFEIGISGFISGSPTAYTGTTE